MMVPFGDAILSAMIKQIMTQLASPDLYTFLRKSKIRSDMEKWDVALLKINAVLEDAEEKQLSNRSVGIWLRQLRDLASDVQNILDEFAADDLLQKRQQPTSSSSKVIPRLVSGLNPRNFLFNKEMESKIKGVSARLQAIVQQKNDLELRESGSGGGVLKSRSSKRLPRTCLVDEYVCGRDGDKKAVLELLFSDKGCDEHGVGVIPIVGMGGVGKTTLAQLVYNDEKVMGLFDLRVWCSVSEDFDVVRVTRTILDAVGSGSCDVNEDLNLLQVSLRDKMMGKRFLIVLDDVWNENYDDWTVLRRPFQMTSPGSKIIVTTRNQGVASMMSASAGYPLKELSFDDSLSLFAKHVFGRANFNDHSDVQTISRKLVQRCKGLPLAVKTLVGLLRTKPSLGEWESLLNSKIWDLSEHQSDVLPALRLSYYHLPSHLKQLFVFCAIIPKDYEFYKDELVCLWMAEGFQPQAGGKKQISLDSCFDELLSRSFFQRSGGKEPRFLMHNLISDLAQSIAGEICVHLSDQLDHSNPFPVLEKARHISFIRHAYEVSQRFKDLGKLKHLQTFMAFQPCSSPLSPCSWLSNNILHKVLPKPSQLRVLSLSGYCIIELPKSIGRLKQLRYLNLSQTKIERLPESVSSLLNLQTLKLYGCRELKKLPEGTGNLISLCHLDITDTDKLLEMPSCMGKLMGLMKLSKFIVGKNGGTGIEELKQLNNLQGRFSIQGLQNVKDARHAVDANLKDKQRLVELELEWSRSRIHDNQNLEHDMDVLNSLQPHKNIQVLKISSYGGTKFPSWVGHPSFTEIVHLKLSNCSKCTALPALGSLPLLRDLCIQGLELVKSVGHEFYGDGSSGKHFPSLTTLKFEDMLNWEFWSSCAGDVEEAEEEFPHLCELTLVNCPWLRGRLPICLPSCVKLTISKCLLLVDSLVKLPLLHEVKLEECNEIALNFMADRSSLTTLKLRSIAELTCLGDQFVWSWKALKVLMISNCSNLICLTSGYSMFSAPKYSQLSGCSKQEHLPIQRLPLEDLCFESCPKLVSIREVDLSSSLRHLVLRDCKALKFLPVGMNKWPLEDLEIEECPLLTCFPGSMLPTTLKRLKVRYCSKLQSLPDGMMHDDNNDDKMHHFEHLEIIGCPSLTFFPAGKLPTQLKMLKIWDCSQLVPLSESMLHDDTSLQYIGISDCSTLTSFPEGPYSFRHLTELFISNCSDLRFFTEGSMALPNLRTLSIFNCAKLKSMPNQMQKLVSLQELTICDCRALVSFPNGDLPPNLTSLQIWDCDALDMPMSDWNLQSLAFLRDFSIAGGCFLDAVSFPEEKWLLPTTLSSVWIGRLPNLESLSVRIQNLTSLEELEIVDCPKLRSLPCEVLPPSLGRFSIRGCPALEQRYFKKKATRRPLIGHIPCFEIIDGIDTQAVSAK